MANEENVRILFTLPQFRITVVGTVLRQFGENEIRSANEQHASDEQLIADSDNLFFTVLPGRSMSLLEMFQKHYSDDEVLALIAFYNHPAARTLRGMKGYLSNITSCWAMSKKMDELDALEEEG